MLNLMDMKVSWSVRMLGTKESGGGEGESGGEEGEEGFHGW
jgi:hypothetical protein